MNPLGSNVSADQARMEYASHESQDKTGTDVWRATKEKVLDAYETVKNKASDAKETVKDKLGFETHADKTTDAMKTRAAYSGQGQGTLAAVNQDPNQNRGAPNDPRPSQSRQAEMGPDAMKLGKTQAHNAKENIKKNLDYGASSVKQHAADAGQDIKESMQNAWDTTKDKVKSATETAKDKLTMETSTPHVVDTQTHAAGVGHTFNTGMDIPLHTYELRARDKAGHVLTSMEQKSHDNKRSIERSY